MEVTPFVLPCGRPLALLLLTALGLTGAGAPPGALANDTPRAAALEAIRRVWPEEHIDSAIRLAHLESGLSPTAQGCAGDCFGLFQIHFAANRSLMASMGIHSPQQLLDPTVNSTVAYRIFRESGWRSWGVDP